MHEIDTEQKTHANAAKPNPTRATLNIAFYVQV